MICGINDDVLAVQIIHDVIAKANTFTVLQRKDESIMSVPFFLFRK